LDRERDKMLGQDDDKRDFRRMVMDCSASFQVAGEGSPRVAVVKDLSAGGVLLLADESLDVGAQLLIEIRPAADITPPLKADLQVVRCDPSQEGGYSVACTIETIHPHIEEE
jgi:hypothetical protein